VKCTRVAYGIRHWSYGVCHWGYGIVTHHWCYGMTLALSYMSVLWHMSFMLWYCDTPLVLKYVIGVTVYVSVVAYVIYVMVL
jgi:hypothetical protein